MRSLPAILFLTQFAATLFMTGLIWFVQVVHYPLFATVLDRTGPTAFRQYEDRHARLTGLVVFPPMAVELSAALAALAPGLRPAFLSPTAAIAGAVLVIAIWLSTGLIQVPLHDRLSSDPRVETVRRLVVSNWLRTVAWTARAIILAIAILKIL